MDKFIAITFFIILIFGCSTKNKEGHDIEMAKKTEQQFDSISGVMSLAIEDFIQSNWMEEFANEIFESNPNFKIDSSKQLEYWIIPHLEIPAKALVRDEIDLFKYMPNAELSLKGANLYLLSDNMRIGKFEIDYSDETLFARPVTFSEKLKNTRAIFKNDYEIWFRPCITFNNLTYYLSGTWFKKDGHYYYLDDDTDRVYPITEYKSYFSTNEKFRNFINKLVDAYVLETAK